VPGDENSRAIVHAVVDHASLPQWD
jgi:hypothetical protein